LTRWSIKKCKITVALTKGIAAQKVTMSLTPVHSSIVSKATGRPLSGSCDPGGPGPGSIVLKKTCGAEKK